MEELWDHLDELDNTANLNPSINDVQKTIDLLTHARDRLASGEQDAPITLSHLHERIKSQTVQTQKDLKPMYTTLNKYSKSLDKKFRDGPLPTAEGEALSSHPSLINRAIAMHLFREGEFKVATTFVKEATDHPPDAEYPGNPNPQQLQQDFRNMYSILKQLRENRNLNPAIEWAREHSQRLEQRGSNLEFDLCKLRYIELFMAGSDHDGDLPMADDTSYEESEVPDRAFQYAKSAFSPFYLRYADDIQALLAAIPFSSNLKNSPYAHIFYNPSAWEEVSTSFIREFCALLGLSADSPLYIAATAGAIALPTLLKYEKIITQARTEWTTQGERPVEIPLPPSYHFHSIFVCPVSKEQSTDDNPPMILPCGHALAKESLERLSKGGKFKCPYCPTESHARDAIRIVF